MSSTNPTRKTSIQLMGLSFLALAGLGVSIVLSQHFYNVRSGVSGFKSFCNIGQTMNCDVVAASPFSELFFGLPISSFAAGWYLALFCVVAFAYNPYWRREATRALFGMTLFGTLLSLGYLAIMMVQIKTYCLFCLILDGITFSSLLLTLSLKPEGFSQHKPNRGQWKVFGGLTLASVALSVGLLKLLEGSTIPPTDLNDLSKGILDTPPIALRTSDELPSIGPKSAPITIVEFSDFQCPWCRIGAFTINSVVNRYPGKIRVIFRNFPMDQACNPALQQSPHPFACAAARAALCAHKQGKFAKTYEELFDKQSTLANGGLSEIMKGLDFNPSEMEACSSTPEIAAAIAKDLEDGHLLGVKSTPTFFINGHKMEGAYPAPVWNSIIEHLLKS